MKTFLIMIMACMMLSVACKSKNGTSSGNEKAEINQDRVVLLEVSIKGMTCTGCENTVKSAVSELPGVTGVSASFTEGKAMVKADTLMVPPDKITAAINGRGYQVSGYKIATSEIK